jgi:predicted RNA binding protein YcfA (HicA-like mRNA interferase family)
MIITAREIIDLFNSDFLSEGQLELPKVIRTTDVVKTYKKMGFVVVNQEGGHLKLKRGKQRISIKLGNTFTDCGMMTTYFHQSGVAKLPFLQTLARL